VGDFVVTEGTSDAFPIVHGFDLHPKNSDSLLGIGWGGLRTTKESMGPDDPIFSISGHVENRRVFDDKGNPIGEDSWGYLENGEQWRRVRLIGWLGISYGTDSSVRDSDAALFDGVISSTCRLSPPTPVKSSTVGETSPSHSQSRSQVSISGNRLFSSVTNKPSLVRVLRTY
jgi:hypothetical protein